MNPVVGWVLAAFAVALAWHSYGWQGALFAISVVVFWLLLQFNRALRVMKNAAKKPVGQVDSAVMLHAKLKQGMTLLQIIQISRSLGRKLRDQPETFAWTDGSGATVEVEIARGRCTQWTLTRPPE